MERTKRVTTRKKRRRTGATIPFYESLQNLPEATQFNVHIWVDYLEMLCLVDNDGELSKADVQDRLRPRADDLKEGGDDLRDSAAETSGQKTDEWVSLINEWYRHLEYRQRTFGDFYPFLLSDNGNVLEQKPALDNKHKFYISLLLSANLNYVGRSHHALTTSFEVISLEVLKRCLPQEAEVHIYGTSPLRPPHRYPGNLWAKITRLANDIKEKVIAEESDFASTNVGDGGLDVVGWVPCGDQAGSLLLVFGQSACTPEWVRKQASSSPEAWRRKMTFTAVPYNMVFIPFCLRNSDGSWHSGSTIQSILMDRQRITHFFERKMEVFQELPSRGIVEKILTSKEGVV
jgi:hypothetical protein